VSRAARARDSLLLFGAVLGTTLLVGLAVCATAGADPAQGQVEEWTVPAVSRGGPEELAVGENGYVWFLAGSGYMENWGYAESISRSAEPLAIGLSQHAMGIDITRGPDGNMWITEQHNWEVEEPDTIGRLEVRNGKPSLEAFKIEPTELGRYCCGPVAITSGPHEHLWFTDRHPDVQHQVFIGEMSIDGDLVEHPIPAGDHIDQAVSPLPDGIAVGPEGDVWFTDDGTNEAGQNLVGRIDAAGESEELPIPTVGAEPAAIALGADGDMWFTEPGNSKIGRVNPATGEIVEFPVPDVTNALKGLVLGPEGKLWFAERNLSPGFGDISPSGEVRSFHPAFEPPESSLEPTGPQSLVMGADGYIWFTDPRYRDELSVIYTTDEGRFAIPLAPQNTQPPVLYGSPTVGSLVTVGTGAWANNPTAEVYQWQRCSTTSSCVGIEGAQSQTYLLQEADIGSHIRAVVTTTNDAGEGVAVSEVSAPIQAAATPTQHGEVLPARVETVGATIASLLSRARHGVIVQALILHNVATGSSVQVLCQGAGCTLAHAARRGKPGPCRHGRCEWIERVAHGPTLNLTSVTRAMRLRQGALLLVTVTFPGAIGRAFEFRIGAHGVPGPVLSCRAPGSSTRIVKC
jgi:virginiamycin B lyase